MKWFDNIKIKNKLFIVFGILLSISFFFAVFAVVGIIQVGDNLGKLTNSYQARQIDLANAITDVYKIRLTNMSKLYMLESNEDLKQLVSTLKQSYEENIRLFNESMKHFMILVGRDRSLNVEDKQIFLDCLDRIERQFARYMSFTRELDKTFELNDRNLIIENIVKSIPEGNLLSEEVEILRDLIFETTKEKTSEYMNAASRITILISGISVIFIILSVFIVLFTIKSINMPIMNLENGVKEIAGGNLLFPIHTDRRDELGSLSNCIGDMIEKLVNFNKMTTIMDNIDSMIYVSDFNYNLLFANKRMSDSFGFDRDACIGQKCYKVMRKKDEPCSFCNMSSLIPVNGSTFPSESYEHVWDDFLSTWVSGNDSVIRWSDDSPVYFRYARDSSLQKRQNELLQETLKTVEMASASKSSFLANMSHEIRTPMNAILGITEILLRDNDLPANIREALSKIYSSGDLLLSIINDILDLSKIEAGKLSISPVKYEVASLINDTITLNLMRAGNKPIDFQLSVEANTPSTLIGDDLRIKQILNNLLSNAFKYTKYGMVKLSVSSEIYKGPDEDKKETMVFRVSDTGQGMSEDQVKKLFEEYSRFNEEANRTTEGTGLGMSITQNLVHLMKGTISVKSEVNWGSVFTIHLPQEKVDSNVLGKELVESLQNFKLSNVKQMRNAQIVFEPMPYGKVLIVDDVESNLYVAKGLLAPYGLTIETAASGFEAIDKIKEGNVYDIVFMDHMMPKMDGIEATERIRELGYKHPIVALTANAVAGQADIFLANGFDGFISKPIDMRELNAELKIFVRNKQPHAIVESARQQAAGHTPHTDDQTVQKYVDPRLAEFFILDAGKAVSVLEQLMAKESHFTEEDFQSYIIKVHGMKSALHNIGEMELSAAAARLEAAGREKDLALIRLETRIFLDKLHAIILQYSPPDTGAGVELRDEDFAYLHEKMLKIKTTCSELDQKAAKAIISELCSRAWPQSIKQQLNEMNENLYGGDFEEVMHAADIIGVLNMDNIYTS